MKINLIVTRIAENIERKGQVSIQANKSSKLITFFPVLDIEANKGDFEVGDKITVTIEKEKK